MPHPLDLSVPRVGVKYPYVPPMRGGAPKYRWDLSQYPAQMDKSQSVPDGKGGSSWLEPPGGSVMTPGAGYGMSVQHSPIEDSVLRNMYDVGEKVSEQETNPYTKSGQKWEHQYNLYRHSLGEIEDPTHQLKAEGEAYPDLTDPEVSPDEWKILQGQDFDVFDAFKDSGTVQGRGSGDYDILTHSIGDIPDAPLSSDQRHESFIGREGYDPSNEGNLVQAVYDMKSVQTVRPGERIEDQIANAYAPIRWDKNMKDNAAISQPAAAKKYLAEMGLEEDCAVMTDPKLRVECEKQKKESMELPSPTSTMRFRSSRKTLPHHRNNVDNMNPREVNLATFDLESY